MSDLQSSATATGVPDFTAVHNNTQLADALGALLQALARAREAGSVSQGAESAARLYLSQAVREANMPAPCKMALLDHLDSARESLEGTDFTRVLEQASETVRTTF